MPGTMKKRDRVHELTDVPFPARVAPDPLILSDEGTLAVAYVTTTPSAAIVVFRQCFANHFGVPNDEAFATHPEEHGLRPCGAFEVESSSWVRGLEMRNRGHPRHDPQLVQQLRHWVWTFQDSVLECAALGYAVQEGQGTPNDLLSQMQALLRSS